MLLDKSHIQYLHDSNGQPTAVLIPINDWKNIEEQVLNEGLPLWQKQLLDERLVLARTNPNQLIDFDAAIKALEDEID